MLYDAGTADHLTKRNRVMQMTVIRGLGVIASHLEAVQKTVASKSSSDQCSICDRKRVQQAEVSLGSRRSLPFSCPLVHGVGLWWLECVDGFVD
jgi:hypothetical protein